MIAIICDNSLWMVDMYKLHKYVAMWKKELQNGERCDCKVIHIKKPTKPEKSSYTPTYSRYPQKISAFWSGEKCKKRTTVLWRNHKLCQNQEKY